MKAQIWSIDLFIAVIIFLLGIGIFYYFIGHSSADKQSQLRIESQIAANKLTGEDNSSLINNSQIDQNKVEDLAGKSYEDIKKDLGLKDDFCIIFKDQDGNLLLLGKNNVTGIGNGNLTLNFTDTSVGCGAVYNTG